MTRLQETDRTPVAQDIAPRFIMTWMTQIRHHQIVFLFPSVLLNFFFCRIISLIFWPSHLADYVLLILCDVRFIAVFLCSLLTVYSCVCNNTVLFWPSGLLYEWMGIQRMRNTIMMRVIMTFRHVYMFFLVFLTYITLHWSHVSDKHFNNVLYVMLISLQYT